MPKLVDDLAVEIIGKSKNDYRCRVWVNKLDRLDGTFIVRYKIYETCYNVSINIFYKSKPVKDPTYKFKG